ncbi:hypothetical protein BH23GEM6_BH23GEM6_26440 [soil metagenome]
MTPEFQPQPGSGAVRPERSAGGLQHTVEELSLALYPERVSILTLLSAGVASSVSEIKREAHRKGDMLPTIFRYDPLYWAASKLFRRQLLSLMGADRTVIARLTPEQKKLLGQVVDYMNPASRRSAGVAFDNGAAMPNNRIAVIQAPTVLIHATDDALQLYHDAEYAVSTIPDAGWSVTKGEGTSS